MSVQSSYSALDAQLFQHGYPCALFVQGDRLPFICSLCSSPTSKYLARRPVELACGHLFCYQCIKQYIDDKSLPRTCPYGCDSKPLPSTSAFKISAFAQNVMWTTPIHCPQGCNAPGLVIGDMEKGLVKHLTDDCPQTQVVCGVCNDVEHKVYRSELEYHKVSSCSHRQVFCNVCEQRYLAKDMAEHQANDVGCVLYAYCPNGCCTREEAASEGVVSPAARLKARFVFPPGADGDDTLAVRTILRKEDVSKHCARDCPLEKRNCPNKCGGIFLDSEMVDHTASKCPKRLLDCAVCCFKFPAAELPSHQDHPYYCRSSIRCPNKCYCLANAVGSPALLRSAASFLIGSAVRQDDDDQHWYCVNSNEKVRETIVPKTQEQEHLALCPLQPTGCRICGEHVQRHTMSNHLERNGTSHQLILMEKIVALERKIGQQM